MELHQGQVTFSYCKDALRIETLMLLLEEPTDRWSQTSIQWFGQQPTKSLLPTKIFLMNDPEPQQHVKGHFDPDLSMSVTMSCLSWPWWDTWEGRRLHKHQLIFDSKVWGKAWTLLYGKPTLVFCNLARNVLQLQHTKQSPLQWHKEEMQTLICPAQTAKRSKRSTGGCWLSYNTQGAAGNYHTGQGQIPHTVINEESKQLHLFAATPHAQRILTFCVSFCFVKLLKSSLSSFFRKIDPFFHMDLLVINQAIIAKLAGRWCIHSFEFLISRAATKNPKTQSWRGNNCSYISKVKSWYIPYRVTN